MDMLFSRRQANSTDSDGMEVSGGFRLKLRHGKQPSWKGWLALIVTLAAGLGFLWNLVDRALEFVRVSQ